MKPVAITNKEILKRTVEIKEYAVGALMQIYAYQTTDEKGCGGTIHDNGMGFNGTDSGFCSSLANQYITKQKLTDKQIAAIQKLIPKYHNQIDVLNPLPLKTLRKRTKKPAGIQQKKAIVYNDRIEITFPHDPNTVAQVKTLSKRRWNATWKMWTCPVTVINVLSILEMDFSLTIDKSADTSAIIRNIGFLLNDQAEPKKKEKLNIPGLKATLREYQEEGIQWIESRDGRAIVGDDMGVGKTLQALAWMQLRKADCLPALVVCTASTKIHWAREAQKFTELKPVLVYGKENKKYVPLEEGSQDIYVANYDITHASSICETCEGTKKVHGIKCKACNGKGKITVLDPELKKIGFKTVIFDECHYIKSNGAGRTAAAKELSRSVEFAIALSGTPIVNKPIEFFNAINMVDNSIVPDWFSFTKRYCDRKHTGFGWDVSGASNKKELHHILTNTLMIRRMKSDVLKELPPKVRSVIPMEINKSKYNKMVDRWKKDLSAAGNKAQHLAIIEKAKQAVISLKMKLCIEWISDYLESGNKLVVFADHRELAEKVVKHFKEKAVIIYGGVNEKKRQDAVDRFQEDPACQLFVGTKAAKEGITLTAADTVAFLELWWTPGDHDQAEDRVLRIGQTSDKMNAYYLLAEGTIEEDIAALLDEKREVTKAVLDGKDVEAESMLSSIMSKILKGRDNEKN